ncbi:CAP domain-containing protein [soil metagenome]
MLIRRSLYTVFTYLLLITLPACAQQNIGTSSVSNINTAEIKSLQNDILKLVNQHRVKLGLKALQMNDAATAEATIHSADMAKGRMAFGHDGFDSRMKHLNQKLGMLRATGENVAYGKIDAEEVMDMWLNSPGHKKNIEGNFFEMGIGIAKSKSGYLYFTQIFLLK